MCLFIYLFILSLLCEKRSGSWHRTTISLPKITGRSSQAKSSSQLNCPQQNRREVISVSVWRMELVFEEKDFLSCCGSTRFAKDMALASPFSSLQHALSVARDIWFNKVDVSGWLQAFSAHPPIGQTRSPSHASQTSAQFSHLGPSLFLYIHMKNHYFSDKVVFFSWWVFVSLCLHLEFLLIVIEIATCQFCDSSNSNPVFNPSGLLSPLCIHMKK